MLENEKRGAAGVRPAALPLTGPGPGGQGLVQLTTVGAVKAPQNVPPIA